MATRTTPRALGERQADRLSSERRSCLSTESASRESVRLKGRNVSRKTGPDARSAADEGLLQLYREQYVRLFRAVWLILGDQGMADEVVQEAFVKVYVAWDRIRDVRRADSYLRSTAFNLARSRLKRRRLERLQSESAQGRDYSAEERIVASEDQVVLNQHLRRLPRRQRECLVLRYYLDLPEAEIAELLKLSPGSVKTHLHRGLGKLGAELEGRS